MCPRLVQEHVKDRHRLRENIFELKVTTEKREKNTAPNLGPWLKYKYRAYRDLQTDGEPSMLTPVSAPSVSMYPLSSHYPLPSPYIIMKLLPPISHLPSPA